LIILTIYLFISFTIFPWKAERYITLILPILIINCTIILSKIQNNIFSKLGIIFILCLSLNLFLNQSEIPTRDWKCGYNLINISNETIILTTAPSINYLFLKENSINNTYWLKEIGFKEESINFNGIYKDPLYNYTLITSKEDFNRIINNNTIMIVDKFRYDWYITTEFKKEIESKVKFNYSCENIIIGELKNE